MRAIIDELYDSILGFMKTSNKLSGSPRLERKSKVDYMILTGNFYFRETADIYPALQTVAGIVKDTIRSHVGEQGEVIISAFEKGEIWDCGQKYFEIKAGYIVEAYCYNCRSLTFVRMTWEKQVFGAEKEWLSIDVDHVTNSLWFEE